MEERVGSYIIDKDGNAVPDMNDEAMAARQKPETTARLPVRRTQTGEIKPLEVKNDA